jgi:hypothetical protein
MQLTEKQKRALDALHEYTWEGCAHASKTLSSLERKGLIARREHSAGVQYRRLHKGTQALAACAPPTGKGERSFAGSPKEPKTAEEPIWKQLGLKDPTRYFIKIVQENADAGMKVTDDAFFMGTGKTVWMLLKALEAMKAGEEVLIVSSSQDFAKLHTERLKGLAGRLGLDQKLIRPGVGPKGNVLGTEAKIFYDHDWSRGLMSRPQQSVSDAGLP